MTAEEKNRIYKELLIWARNTKKREVLYLGGNVYAISGRDEIYGAYLIYAHSKQEALDKANKIDRTADDGECSTCEYNSKNANEEPCVRCCYNYPCMFEPKSKTKELSETELQEAFKEKFQDRRAISLDEIERVIRGLFE